MQELEALSNHYTLLCNRARAKLSGEQRTTFETQLKQLQQVLTFNADSEVTSPDSGKGKKVAGAAHNGNDIKVLRESSVSQAAEMATGYVPLCQRPWSLTNGSLLQLHLLLRTRDEAD